MECSLYANLTTCSLSPNAAHQTNPRLYTFTKDELNNNINFLPFPQLEDKLLLKFSNFPNVKFHLHEVKQFSTVHMDINPSPPYQVRTLIKCLLSLVTLSIVRLISSLFKKKYFIRGGLMDYSRQLKVS